MAEVNIADNINTIFSNLEKILTSKTVFGEAITVGETILIPVVDISFGLGTGGGSGEDKNKGGGAGSGGGAGCRMSASAVIVIKGEHVQVMQIKPATHLGKLVDMIPEIVDKFKSKREKEEEQKEG